MPTVAIPDDDSTLLLAGSTSTNPGKVLVIQNLNPDVDFYLKPYPGFIEGEETGADNTDFFLPRGEDKTTHVLPTTFITDDPALVNAKWLAFQNSGGSANLNIQRW